MTTIGGIGQGIFEYVQSGRAVHDAPATQPATESDPDASGSTLQSAASPFESALLKTLRKFGVDPEAFQAEFMANLRSLTTTRPSAAEAMQSAMHLNAVG